MAPVWCGSTFWYVSPSLRRKAIERLPLRGTFAAWTKDVCDITYAASSGRGALLSQGPARSIVHRK